MAVGDKGPAGNYQEHDYLLREVDHYAGKKYELIVLWLAARGGGQVLNFGCGRGELNSLLAQRGYTVDAVDPSPSAVTLAERRRRESGLGGIRVWQADVFSVTAGTPRDAVVWHDVLEHIEDDRAAAQPIAAPLRPTAPSSSRCRRCSGGSDITTSSSAITAANLHPTGLLDECFGVRRSPFFGFSLIPIVLLYSRLRGRPYPVQKSASAVARLVLAFEGAVLFAFGTSLLMKAEKC